MRKENRKIVNASHSKSAVLIVLAGLMFLTPFDSHAARATGPSGQSKYAVDSEGNYAYYPAEDQYFASEDQGMTISGGVIQTHYESPVGDEADYYYITDWEAAVQYIWLSQEEPVCEYSEVEMDGRIEWFYSGEIEPYVFHSLTGGGSMEPKSIYTANPSLDSETWYYRLPQPYQAYKGQGKSIRVKKYLRGLNENGVECLLPIGEFLFTDENPSEQMQH